MYHLLLFLLVVDGCTDIITSSKLFAGFRTWVKLEYEWAADFVKCPSCIGFWAAVFWYLFDLAEIGSIISLNYLGWLAAGAMGSVYCWTMRVIRSKLGEDSL